MFMQCKKSTPIFPWALPYPFPSGGEKIRGFWFGLVCVWVYHLPFVGNVWSSHGSTLQLLQWEQHIRLDWALLGAALCLEPFAWRLCPCNCVTSSLKILPGHDGAGRAPSPKSHTKPQPSVIPIPQEIADSLCISYHYICTYFSTVVFLYSRNFNILVLLTHEKKNLVFLLMSLSSFHEWMANTGVIAPH